MFATHFKSRALNVSPLAAQPRAAAQFTLLTLVALLGAIAGRSGIAATLTWDADGSGTTGVADGPGTWDTSTLNWSPDLVGGATDVTWNNNGQDNTNLDVAAFGNGGTAGTVTLNTGITLGGMIFNSGTTGSYTIAGATGSESSTSLTFGGASPTITTNADATISAVVNGSAGLTKAGPGMLTLSGNSTFTGGLNVTAGTLFANLNSGTTAALGASGANPAVTVGGTGATLTLSRNGSGAFPVNNAQITVNDGGTLNLVSNTTSNPGTDAVFSHPINVSGTTTINLTYQGGGSRGSEFELNSTTAANVTVNLFTGGGSANSDQAGWYFLAGGLNNAASLAAGSTLTINGGGSSSMQWRTGGAANIQTMLANTDVIFGSAPIAFNLGNGGSNTLQVNSLAGGAATTFGSDNTASVIRINNGTTAGADFAGSITDGAGGGPQIAVTKNGSGTQIFSGSNSYSGTTTIIGGTLQIGDGGTTGTLGSAGVSDNGTLAFKRSDTVTISNTIGGSGGVSQNGSGNLILGATDGYSGTTRVNAGTLTVNSSLTSTSSVAVNAGTFVLTGTISGSAPVTVGNGGTFRFNNSTSVNSLTVNSGGTLAAVAGKTGTVGTLTFGATTGDTGTMIAALATGYTPFTTSNLVVNGGASSIALSLSGSGLVSGNTYNLLSYGSTNITDASAFQTIISGRVSYSPHLDTVNKLVTVLYNASLYPIWTGALSSEWSTNTLSGPKNWKLNSDSSPTDYLAGDTVVFDDSAASSTVDVSVANVAPSSTAFNNSTLNYTLQGSSGISSGSLSKSGSAALTITNANSYSAGTSLSGGRLRIGNNSALGSGLVTFTSGVLSSDGTTARSFSNDMSIGGAVTLGDAVNNGALALSGSVDLGGSTRTLTVNSAVSMSNAISNGGLVKAGPGTLTLSGNSTFTGGVNVTGGTLIAVLDSGTTASLGASGSNPAVAVGGTGATLTLSRNGTGAFPVNNALVTLNDGATLNLVSNSPSGNPGTDAVFSHPINVAGTTVINLTFNGGGSRGSEFELNSTSPANVTVNLFVGGGSANSDSAGWYFLDGGLNNVASLAAGSTLTINGGGTATMEWRIGHASNVQAMLANTDVIFGSSAVGFNLGNGGADTLQVNSLAGGAATTIRSDNVSSVIQINNGTTAGANFAGTIRNGDGGGAQISLVKNGTGTQILSGTSTYSGTTTLNGGLLRVANSAGSATGSGQVTLNGGTLGGAVGGGAVGGLVIAGSGPHSIAPGAGLGAGSFGTLTLNGGLTTASNTTLTFNLGTTFIRFGTNGYNVYGGDLLNVNGTLTVVSGTHITFGANPTTKGDYRLIGGSVGSTDMGSFVIPPAPANVLYSLSNSVDSGFIDLVVSPINSSQLTLPSGAINVNMHVGDTGTPGATSVMNSDTAFAGHFTPSGAGLTFNSPTSGNVPAAQSVALNVGWSDTGSAGPRSGTIAIANDSNTGDSSTPKTQAVSGGVYDLAGGSVSNGATLTFLNYHVGATVSAQSISITNSGTNLAYTESLDAAFGTAAAGIVANGSIASGMSGGLAAGSTDSSSMSVGVNTSVPAVNAGAVAVNFTSDGIGSSGLGYTAAGSQSITINNGNVYSGKAQWNVGGGTWSTPTNWKDTAMGGPNMGAPGLDGVLSAGDSANFVGAPATITLDVSPSLAAMTLGPTGAPTTGYTIAPSGTNRITLTNGTNPATVTLNSGVHTISAPVTVTGGLTVSGAGSVTLTGGGNNFTGPIFVGNATTPDTAKLVINAATASTVAANVTATVAAGATLELDGTASALTDSANAAHRANVLNDGSLVIAGGTAMTPAVQQVGGIDPYQGATGSVTVSDNAQVTADHINQSSLVIGAGSVFTLAPSDMNGNSMAAVSGQSRGSSFVLAKSLTPSSSFVADGGGFLGVAGPANPAAPFSLGGVGGTNLSAVPEPSSIVVLVLGILALGLSKKTAPSTGHPGRI